MTSDVIHRLKQILGKYEQVRGIQVWGSEDSTPTGVIHVLRVDANGRLEIVGAGGAGLATEATQLLVEGRLDELDDALTSIGTDQLRVDIIGQGGLATQATLAAVLAAQATAANQTTMITSLQLIDDLRDALNSVAVDELRVLISDPTTPANRARVLAATDQDTPDLDDELLQTCHTLLCARLDVNTTKGLAAIDIGTTYGLGVGLLDAAGNRMPTMDAVGRPGFQKITNGAITVDLVPNIRLDLLTTNYAGLPVLATVQAYDGARWLNLGISGIINRNLNTRIRQDGNEVAVINPFENYETPAEAFKTTALIVGEDLEVGAGNSEPAKIRIDNGSLSEGEKHLVVLCLNLVKDGNVWIPMTQPS